MYEEYAPLEAVRGARSWSILAAPTATAARRFGFHVRAHSRSTQSSFFLKDYDADEAFDRDAGIYDETFTQAFLQFVERTTGKSPDVLIGNQADRPFLAEVATVDRRQLTQQGMNDLIYEVKAHLAGKMAQARYAIAASRLGTGWSWMR